MDRWEEFRCLLGWEVEPLTEADFLLTLSFDEWHEVYRWLRRQEREDDKQAT